ncbi:hypothetical protein [Kitasatospora sp. NPDC002040]|uniref:hypothetical protein n=1 Tax=Kitasatospora sp. NPDC002040 TaxID=3154661 RepID=UPI003326EFA8
MIEFIHQETGRYPRIAEQGTADFAMGVAVYVRERPYAVICPAAARVTAIRSRLAPLLLIAATERERRRIAAQAGPGQRIEVIGPVPAAMAEAAQPQHCVLTANQTLNRMMSLDRL